MLRAPAVEMQPLPIDPILPEIVASLRRTPNLVLTAPPGAGKTTRVPRALLDAGFADAGEILVLEPRRLAARMAARRVADELGEAPGETCGYQMRFEDVTGPRTRIRFVTEGTLTRRLLVDRELRGVGTVLLDELHERHLEGDVALALLRRMQRGPRPDLRLVAMSATLDAGPVAAFLDAPVLAAEGRRFDVAIEHLAQADDRPLEAVVASAVRRLVDEGLDGDVLVFLPGALEIRRAAEACAAIASRADLLVLPLHGTLSPAEQDRAVRPADRRKVILSTNVAETSVTIDGVVAVVDSGLARVMTHAPWSGLPTLRVAKIARASATQRAGRAGRTRPGRCLRLYTKGDHAARPEHETPEIARADLAEPALELFAAGVPDLAAFAWLEAPPRAPVEAAVALLERLGAIERDANGAAPTAIGRRMLRFPVHPRLGRMLVEAERRGVAEEACALAALVSEREIGSGRRARDARHASDALAALAELEEAEAAGFAPERLRWIGLDPARVAAVERVRKQLARLVERRPRSATPAPAEMERRLSITLLAGYPDRVGRLRRPANATGRSAREIVFAGGGTAVLAESSGVADVDLVIAIDAEERSEADRARTQGRGGRTLVRMASAIEADWLLDLFTDAIRDTTDAIWNAASERVEVVRRLSYDGLVLEETRAPSGDPRAIARVLADAVRARGWRAFARSGGDELDRWMARVAFAREHCPDAKLPAVDEVAIDAALADLCEGSASFADLAQHDLAASIRALLTPAEARLLDDLAPDALTLPGGRRLRITYTAGAAPSAGSRLQDFFGMSAGPVIARGRVPVVLHLLAPNQRAVQVTTDLAGFWSRHYPAIARELRRKYPKHAWPDDPLTARPPEPRPPRR